MVNVRWMTRCDFPKILEIEAQSFEFPWSKEDFISCLIQRHYIGMTAELDDDRVVGFMIYELQKWRIKIVNFAACPKGKGVGRQMIKKLIGKLSLQRRSLLEVNVRESNLPVQLFFKAMGFHAVSILRDFFIPPENAYRMVYRIRPEAKKPETSCSARRVFQKKS